MISLKIAGPKRSWSKITAPASTMLPHEDFVLRNQSTFKPFERYSDRLLALSRIILHLGC